MLSIIGNQYYCKTPEARNRFNKVCNFLDFAGGITAIVLGALALTHLGGNTIAHLNDVTCGGYATIGGGLATLYALHLQTRDHSRSPLPDESSDEDPRPYSRYVDTSLDTGYSADRNLENETVY